MIWRWALFLSLSSAIGWSQQANSTGSPSPEARFATVTAKIEARLDTKACAVGKEFRATVVTPFIFTGDEIRSNAYFLGHIRACNRDLSDKLSTAVVVVDTLTLPDNKVVPVEAVLQALGGAVEVSPVITGVKDSPGFPGTSSANDIALHGPTTVGLLDGKSKGTVGLKHIAFENAVADGVVAWIFSGERAPLALAEGSQLVVRFRIAAPPQQHR